MQAYRVTSRRFRSDEQGAVAIIFALIVVCLFGMIAFAVDMARAYSVSSRVTAALDAAALAGAKMLDKNASTSEIQAVAQKFFETHMANQRIGNVTLANFNAVIDKTTSTVVTNVDAKMDTMFARVAGINTIDIKRSATVVYKIRNVELAMALDITGSMDANGKISGLKNAAREVIDTLLGDAGAEDGVRIALVPWSSSVNAGSLAGTATNNVSVDNCVVERPGATAATDDAPGGGSYYNAVTTPDGHYGCPGDAVMPLKGRSQINALKDTVNNYTAMGWTAGHIGASWAWNMVSPKWAGVVPSSSAPRAYNPAETIKAVVIMTDGLFNTSFVNGTTTPEATMVEESYTQFQALCTNMKAQKVIVYTIGFDLTDTRATTELGNCATSSTHFFQAVNSNDLSNAFQAIASQLTGMRITR